VALEASNHVRMTAAESQLAFDTELERIEQWRVEELERAGYAVRDAKRIATRHDIDLHFAVDLITSGCSHELALQILL
jgi:hypothetical protein